MKFSTEKENTIRDLFPLYMLIWIISSKHISRTFIPPPASPHYYNAYDVLYISWNLVWVSGEDFYYCIYIIGELKTLCYIDWSSSISWVSEVVREGDGDGEGEGEIEWRGEERRFSLFIHSHHHYSRGTVRLFVPPMKMILYSLFAKIHLWF